MVSLLNPKTIAKFVNPLPNLLTPGLYIDARGGGTYYVTMSQGNHNFGLGSTFGNTSAWGYHSPSAPLWDSLGLNYLGPTIVTQENTPISVNWINNLPGDRLFDVDTTVHGAHENSMGSRISVQPHVHGGLTAASSDGNPFATDAFTGTQTYQYENRQDAATSWYHDHALGITRLNVYAGLAGFYLIRDNDDSGAADNPSTGIDEGNPLDLPANFDPGTPNNPLDDINYEFPIVIQDKTFDTNGNLYYPTRPGDPLAGPGNLTVPVPPGIDPLGNPNPFPGAPTSPTVVPEYGGNIMVVNGVTWPTLQVEPRTYRFRLLNGSDSRFYELKLPSGLDFKVIGSDNSLLDSPAVPVKNLLIAPGERYDAIVDFSKQAGKTLTLSNVAGGKGTVPIFNDPQSTGQVMQFQVKKGAPTIPDPVNPQWKVDLRPDPADTIPVWSKNADGTWSSTVGTTTAPGVHDLAIFEGIDPYGRIFPHLGTADEGSLLWEHPVDETDPTQGSAVFAAPAETVAAGQYTLFEVYNTTPDAHPIHLHGTTFQVLERQQFQVNVTPKIIEKGVHDHLTGEMMGSEFYQGGQFVDLNNDGSIDGNDITLFGQPTPVAAFEAGFKDTAVVNPGERILVVAQYDPAVLNDPLGSDVAGKYVWHCHILSHEDHEMMRPLQIV